MKKRIGIPIITRKEHQHIGVHNLKLNRVVQSAVFLENACRRKHFQRLPKELVVLVKCGTNKRIWLSEELLNLGDGEITFPHVRRLKNSLPRFAYVFKNTFGNKTDLVRRTLLIYPSTVSRLADVIGMAVKELSQKVFSHRSMLQRRTH